MCVHFLKECGRSPPLSFGFTGSRLAKFPASLRHATLTNDPSLYIYIHIYLPSILLYVSSSTANFGTIRDASVEGGSTSIQMMSAKFGQADVARAELSATVTQQLADAEDKTASTIADIQTEMATQAQEVTDQLVETREQVDADLADAEDKTASTIADIQTEMATQAQEVTDQLVETREQVDADLAAAVETSKNYADNAIENTVTPALTKVASDLVALETKIKKDIDEDIKTTLTIYENILVGTAACKF